MNTFKQNKINLINTNGERKLAVYSQRCREKIVTVTLGRSRFKIFA